MATEEDQQELDALRARRVLYSRVPPHPHLVRTVHLSPALEGLVEELRLAVATENDSVRDYLRKVLETLAGAADIALDASYGPKSNETLVSELLVYLALAQP